ncbi:MAG: FAD-binding protein, partial [Pirellulales bacterium]
TVRSRFPGMARTCAEFGLDLTRDRIPVRPGAHYMIGGVAVDREGRTSLPGLFAAGEVTSSGLHGANRLASNSLLEGLVYGARSGAVATAEALATGDDFRVPRLSQPRGAAAGEPLDLEDIRNSLRSLMWRSVGVERSGMALTEAAETVEGWCRYVLPRQFADPRGWQLQNMLEVARLMIQAASTRRETRGVHVRSDYPAPNDDWRVHLAWERGGGGAIREPLPPEAGH